MWQVVTVERFDDWFLALNNAQQTSILAAIFKYRRSARSWRGRTPIRCIFPTRPGS